MSGQNALAGTSEHGTGVPLIHRVALAVSVVALVVITCSVTYDVLARYLANSPTIWANEISRYFLIIAIFFGIIVTELSGRNINVDIIINRLPDNIGNILNIVSKGLGAYISLCAVWYVSLNIMDDYSSQSVLMGMLLTPKWIPKVPIAIGFLLLYFVLINTGLRQIDHHGRLHVLAVNIIPILGLVFLVIFGNDRFTYFDVRLRWADIIIPVIIFAQIFLTNKKSAILFLLYGCVILYVLYLCKGSDASFAILGIGVLILVLLLSGIQISYTLGIIGFLSLFVLAPIPMPSLITARVWEATDSFVLISIPMFILMGNIIVESRLSSDLFSVLSRFLRRTPGGLTQAALAGCGLFAAISGSSVATAATIGTAACPEMINRGYSHKLAYGSVAAGGTLGILIPPSIPLIVYGTTVGASVSRLFIAGILPGILLMMAFMAVSAVWSMQKGAVPVEREKSHEPITGQQIIGTLGITFLLGIVIFSLYFGIATPTETGAVGSVAALLIVILSGKYSHENFISALIETIKVTSFILLIIVMANLLSYSFDILQLSQRLMQNVLNYTVDRFMVFLVICLFYIILGMFLDSISMMVLTLPIIFPLVVELGFDPIWFGIIVVVLAEIGLITPPVGMNLFVLGGIDHRVDSRSILLGVLPYLFMMLAFIAVLYVFPGIVTALAYHVSLS